MKKLLLLTLLLALVATPALALSNDELSETWHRLDVLESNIRAYGYDEHTAYDLFNDIATGKSMINYYLRYGSMNPDLYPLSKADTYISLYNDSIIPHTKEWIDDPEQSKTLKKEEKKDVKWLEKQ